MMRALKYLISNVTIINMILTAVLIAGVMYIVQPLHHMNIKFTLPSPKKVETVKEEQVAQNKEPSLVDFSIIAEQNLFHPDRKIPPENASAQQLPQPEFILYGILISDDYRVAYLEDKKSPLTTQGRGKRQTVLRKGETISGFTLKEIEADKVVMVRGEESILVYLNDPQRPKTREGETTAASAATPGQQPPLPQQQLRAMPKQSPQQQQGRISSSVPQNVPQVPSTVPHVPSGVAQAPSNAPPPAFQSPVSGNIKTAPAPSIPSGGRSGSGNLLGIGR
jgi:hypothetical protein